MRLHSSAENWHFKNVVPFKMSFVKFKTIEKWYYISGLPSVFKKKKFRFSLFIWTEIAVYPYAKLPAAKWKNMGFLLNGELSSSMQIVVFSKMLDYYLFIYAMK